MAGSAAAIIAVAGSLASIPAAHANYGPWELLNGYSRLCLAVAGAAPGPGATVILWYCNEYPDKLWQFVPIDVPGTCPIIPGIVPSCYQVVNQNSDLCLTAVSGGSIIQLSCNPDPISYRYYGQIDDIWMVDPQAPSSHVVDIATGYCLAIAGAGNPTPAPGDGSVIVWPCNDSSDKVWTPIP